MEVEGKTLPPVEVVDEDHREFFKKWIDERRKEKDRVEDILAPIRKENSRKQNVTIAIALKPDEQQLLINSYPEFHLTFTSEINHQHGFAAASRKLELQVLLRRLNVNELTKPYEGYDDYLCDIGGDFSCHLRKGDNIHSCCPSLDIRDDQRYSTRMESLRRDLYDKMAVFDLNKRNRIIQFLRGDKDIEEQYWCNRSAQQCDRTARYGMCLHSSYDISINDFSDIMIRKNMTELYGSFIYDDQVFLDDCGTIAGVKCLFTVDKANDTIEFSFQNDPSLVYKHSYKNYLALLTLNSFRSKCGNFSYVIELLENRAGVQFFKITRLNKRLDYVTLTKFLWLPSLAGKTKVKFFNLDQRELAAGNFKKCLKPVVFYVDSSTIDKVAAHAYASTESKFRPVEIFGFLLAYNGRIFFGSDVCVRFKQLPFEQAVMLANAIYLYVYARKYDVGKIDQLLIAAIKHDRELAEGSIWRKILKGKFDFPSSYGSHHSHFKFIRKIAEPLHRITYWMNKSSFDVREFLSENCKFIRCDDQGSWFDIVFKTGNECTKVTYQLSAVVEESRAIELRDRVYQIFQEFCLHPEDQLCAVDKVVPLLNRVSVKADYNVSKKKFARMQPILCGDKRTTLRSVKLSINDVPSPTLEGSTLVVGENVSKLNNCKINGKVFVAGITQKLDFKADSIEWDGSADDLVSIICSLNVVNVVLLPCSESVNALLIPCFNRCFHDRIKFYTCFSKFFNDFNLAFLCTCTGRLGETYFECADVDLVLVDKCEGGALASSLESAVERDDQEFLSVASTGVNGFLTNDLREKIWVKFCKDDGVYVREVSEVEKAQIELDVKRSVIIADKELMCTFIKNVLSHCRGSYYQGFHDVCAVVYYSVGEKCATRVLLGLVDTVLWMFLEREMADVLEVLSCFFLVLPLFDYELSVYLQAEVIKGQLLGFFVTLGAYVCRDLAKCKVLYDFVIVSPPAMVGFLLLSYLIHLKNTYSIDSSDKLIECLSKTIECDWLEIITNAKIMYNKNDRSKLNDFFTRRSNIPNVSPVEIKDEAVKSGSVSEFVKEEGVEGVLKIFNLSDDCIKTIKDFCDNLPKNGKVRKGEKGDRHEFLYSPYPYVYGKEATAPIAQTIPSVFAPYVDFLHYNTLLVVYYPEGTTGLNYHKDNECCMASEKVLTFSWGSACTLKLKSSTEELSFKLDSTKGYELLSQKHHRHAVEVCGPRYALTFRKRKVKGVDVKLPGCVLSPIKNTVRLPVDFVQKMDDKVYKSFESVMDNVDGYEVCRSEHKLREILPLVDEWIRDASVFVDLCASPGGWTNVLQKRGKVYSYCLPGTNLKCGTPIFQDILQLKELPDCDLVVADGASVKGFDKDLGNSVKIIQHEIKLALPLLIRGKFLLVKVHIGPYLMEILKGLKDFKIFRIFRPNATKAISHEAYVFVGGGLGGNTDYKAYVNACFDHRIKACQTFVMVTEGAKLNRSICTLHSDVLEMGGGGDCLFYCLSGGDYDAACRLRRHILKNRPEKTDFVGYRVDEVDQICSTAHEQGDTSVIYAFCELFHSNAKIFCADSGKLLVEFKVYAKPFYDIELYYTGYPEGDGHYQLKYFEAVTKLCRREILYDPINLDTLWDRLLGTMFDSSVKFFNTLANRCFSDNCDCFGGLAKFISSGKDFVVFTHERVYNVGRIISRLTKAGYEVNFLCPTRIVSEGYWVLWASTFKSKTRAYNPHEAWERVKNHVKGCKACASEDCYLPGFYDHFDRAYYFCNVGELVTTVNNLEDADLVFELVPSETNILGYSGLVDRNDVVEIPIRLAGKGTLYLDSVELKHLGKLVSDFFDYYGTVKIVGVINRDIYDVTPIVKLFKKYCSKVLVNSKNVACVVKGLNYSPDFEVTTGDMSYIRNAMVEAREYFKATNSAIVNKLKPLHDQYAKLRLSGGNYDSFNDRRDFAIVDMDRGTYVVPPKWGGGPYNYAFDGEALVDISRAVVDQKVSKKNYGTSCAWLKPGVFSGYYSVSNDTKLINSHKIYHRLKGYNLKNVKFSAKIELIEGVPGCGKTKYIIDHHSFSAKDCRHVVLTSSREAVEDMRRRVAVKHSLKEDDKILLKRYRTVDSFLMHFDNKDQIDVLWMDEGLMKHFGDLMWCALVSGCKLVKIIGDRAQIPFHNRLANVDLRFSLPTLSEKYMKVKFLSTTYRCPVDVAVCLNRFGVYKEQVKSASEIERSLNVVQISSVRDVLDISKDAVLLTFTNEEKMKLVHEGHQKVFTINEFQGSQAKKVVLVRENPKKIPLFESQNHMLVAVSRHTHSFVYATRVRDDPLALFLSRPISQLEIVECTMSKFAGGGVILGKTSTRQFPLYSVVPKCATMIDMLKQDARIRNFVQDNLGSGLAPFRVETKPIECFIPELLSAEPLSVSDPLTNLQFMYDEIFPGQSTETYDYDDELFQQDELFFAVKEMIRLPTFEKQVRSRYDHLTPVLRTSCPSPVSMTTKNILKAFYDRNGDVPQLQGMVDDEGMAQIMFDKFRKCYVRDKALFDRFEEEPVNVNVDSIEDWLFTQDPKVKDLAFGEEFMQIFQKELNVYSMILKKLPKPKLEKGAEYKFPSPQTIAHSSKDINAFFCPIIRELKKRLLSVLHPNVVMFTDISIADFEDLLTVRLSKAQLKELKYLFEADMAKYDKSQNLVALLYEIKILTALGFPVKFIPTWLFMHVFTKLICRFLGIVFKIFYQRKSGDPMTFFGNTLFLMAVIAVLIVGLAQLIVSGKIFLLFSGDDFLAFCAYLLEVLNFCHEAANIFNLEAKVVKFSTPYFCSKFLIMTPSGRWVCVPDIPKMLTKLGRRDLINEAHVDEYRVSCRDVGKHLGNALLYPFLDAAMCDRYSLGDRSFAILYSSMFKIFNCKETFRKLYFRKDVSVIDSKRVFVKLNDF